MSMPMSYYSRAWLYRLAWVLFIASLLCPSPARSAGGGAYYSTAFYMLAHVLRPEAMPVFAHGLDPWRVAVFTLALFTNTVFLFTPVMRRCSRVSRACAAFLVGTVAVDVSAAFVLPELARTVAYWIWLASMAVVAWAFLALPGPGQAAPRVAGKRARTPEGNDAPGEVPGMVWAWFGFTVFWLAVNFASQSQLSGSARSATPAVGAPPQALTSYLTDAADLLDPGEVDRFNASLAGFERETSIQMAVAIYPDVPASIEDFTIRTAEASRLGRKGLDNGAILFIFPAGRVARLEVGYGLEPVLNDAKVGHILETTLAPAWRRGAYADAIDATTTAIATTVRDAYAGGQMPGWLAVFRRQLAVEIPRMARGALPGLASLDLSGRLGITFFGTLIGMGLLDGFLQLFHLLRYGARRAAALLGRGRTRVQLEPLRVTSMVDSVKVMVIVAALIASVAGVVIVAGGGAFGGAGAMCRW